MGGQKFRRACFTINDGEWGAPDDLPTDCRYFVCQKEIAPSTGRVHYQGYIELKNKSLGIAGFKKILNCNSAHIEQAKGTPEQASEYCKKADTAVEGTLKEYGTLGGNQGARTDLNNAAEKVKNGTCTVDDLCLENPMLYHVYGRTLSKIEDIVLRQKVRTTMTTCEWIYGPTGTGKSHKAFENFHPDTHYVWKNDNGWQDGYKGQKIVIINDFRGEIPYNELLQMIDKWAWYVKRRNREPMPFTSEHVIITSSLHPKDVYKQRIKEDSLEQLYRRITITRLGPDDPFVDEYEVN